MIKLYDPETTKHMLDILELLMLKTMSYSWISVCTFNHYLVWQVELRWLEWTDILAIHKMAAISFKHSDLRTAKVNSNRPLSSSQPNANADGDRPKGCCLNSD